MKIIAATLLVAVYVLLGIIFDEHEFIVKHAYWSTFGAVFGILFMAIIGDWEN